MIYVYIGIIALVSFLGGIFIAIRLTKKEYSPDTSSDKNITTASEITISNLDQPDEEQTRKVELVDFEDLLEVDGDVIEAEPAPVVPEDYLYRAQHEIRLLKDQVEKLERREESTQFVMEKLKKDSDESKKSES